jgi:peptidoglycan hydrolase CwlO-like protein
MRKTIFFGVLLIFAMSSTVLSASETTSVAAKENSTVLAKADKKLSADELAVMTARVEEIRNMDKSNMTATEKRELRKESKAIKENVNKDGGVIYISVGTVLLIVLIIILI